MSADNGYILRRNSAQKFVLQMFFLSNDIYPPIDAPNSEVFDTLEEALVSYELGTNNMYWSEYGLYVEVTNITYTKQEEDSNMLNVQTYVRKPFEVVAVQVTEENIELVASWCGGTVKANNDGARFIDVKVHNPQSARHSKAMVGDWVLSSGNAKRPSYKVYLEQSFLRAFDLKAVQTNQKRREVLDAVELMTVQEPEEKVASEDESIITFKDTPEPSAVAQVQTGPATVPASIMAAASPKAIADLVASKNAGRF